MDTVKLQIFRRYTEVAVTIGLGDVTLTAVEQRCGRHVVYSLMKISHCQN